MDASVWGFLGSVAVGILSLAGVLIANRKTTALMDYRLQELEKKFDKHNLVERIYKVEERTELQEAELKRHNERLKNLEAVK